MTKLRMTVSNASIRISEETWSRKLALNVCVLMRPTDRSWSAKFSAHDLSTEDQGRPTSSL